MWNALHKDILHLLFMLQINLRMMAACAIAFHCSMRVFFRFLDGLRVMIHGCHMPVGNVPKVFYGIGIMWSCRQVHDPNPSLIQMAVLSLAVWGHALSCIKMKSSPIASPYGTTTSARTSSLYLWAFMVPLPMGLSSMQPSMEMPPQTTMEPPPKGSCTTMLQSSYHYLWCLHTLTHLSHPEMWNLLLSENRTGHQWWSYHAWYVAVVLPGKLQSSCAVMRGEYERSNCISAVQTKFMQTVTQHLVK